MTKKKTAVPTTPLSTVAVASQTIAELDKGNVSKARQLLVGIAGFSAAQTAVLEALAELDRGNHQKARRLLRRTAGSPLRPMRSPSPLRVKKGTEETNIIRKKKRSTSRKMSRDREKHQHRI